MANGQTNKQTNKWTSGQADKRTRRPSEKEICHHHHHHDDGDTNNDSACLLSCFLVVGRIQFNHSPCLSLSLSLSCVCVLYQMQLLAIRPQLVSAVAGVILATSSTLCPLPANSLPFVTQVSVSCTLPIILWIQVAPTERRQHVSVQQ